MQLLDKKPCVLQTELNDFFIYDTITLLYTTNK